MKNHIKFLEIPFVLLFLSSVFLACDKEFTEIESDVLGQDNVNFSLDTSEIPIISYNKKLEDLQVDNLKASLLGVYNDPNFGKTTASIVTQLTPKTFNPNFGTDLSKVIIDSVVLKIPYFNRSYGNDTYTIKDSLFGEEQHSNIPQPFKLSVYRTNYYLNFDGATDYYALSDGRITYNKTAEPINFDNILLKVGEALKFIKQDDKGKDIGAFSLEGQELTPSEKPKILTSLDDSNNKVVKKLAPTIYYKLENSFWESLIIAKQGQAELSNANNFRNYFRGFYFKAEPKDANTSSMVMLNLDSPDANITIYYKPDVESKQSTYVLNFTGNRVNTFDNTYDKVTLSDGDNTIGDEKLYLKGTNGSMALVSLFTDDKLKAFYDEFRIPDGNDGYLKDSNGNYILKKLINDAQLVIYEDENLLDKEAHKYDRIYAYNVVDNTATADYLLDATQNLQNAYNSRVISLGKRIEYATGKFKYKIRLTEHLKNMLLADDTTPNTKIGLVLSTNVNLINHSKLLNSTVGVTEVPAASIITPRGTVLYGNNVSVENESKRMKLEIFTTASK